MDRLVYNSNTQYNISLCSCVQLCIKQTHGKSNAAQKIVRSFDKKTKVVIRKSKMIYLIHPTKNQYACHTFIPMNRFKQKF